MGNKKIYNWTADGSYLPDIPLYAKTKHLVLQEYVRNWIEVLCGHGKHGVKTVTLVDGFCGGGMYKDGNQLWEGSSIRMIRMVEEGLKNVQKRKPWHKLDAEFIFIDSNREHTSCLELQLKNQGLEHYLSSGKCRIITNRFDKELNNCLERVRTRKGYSFFFLDPFGLDVTPEIVKEIISLGKSEVFFTHMLSGLVRVLFRKDKIHKKTFQDFAVDEYYKDAAAQGDFLKKQAYLRNQGLLLYRKEGNVKHAWTFAIMDSPKKVLYYLIHLSSNPTALDVMKQTVWKYNNLEYQYHYGVYGLGFREIDFYDKNLTIYNIEEVNLEGCLNNLTNQLIPILYEYEDGLTFEEIYRMTIDENPATKEQYMALLNQLRIEKEIKIIRNGKITTSKNREPEDLIIKAKDKPLWIPGLPLKF